MASIYLDYNATTPVCDQIVIDSIVRYNVEIYGNSSSSHKAGNLAKQGIERSRKQLADLLSCDPSEITFTSGATEANNYAIKVQGTAFALKDVGKHIITTKIEHPAVEETAKYLADKFGYEVTFVDVDSTGMVPVEDIEKNIRKDTILVSVMHSNNEVGTLQPIAQIGKLIKTKYPHVLFHSDCSQSIGKVKIDVNELNVDLLTVAAHKFYAPKGSGCLYIRKGTKIDTYLHGSTQEYGKRAGTHNTAYYVALGEAAELANKNLEKNSAHMRETRDLLYQELSKRIPDLVLNSDLSNCLPNTLSVSLPRVMSYKILEALYDKMSMSAGPACHDPKAAKSTTLSAMKRSQEVIAGTLRLSTGKATTKEDVVKAAELIASTYESLLNKSN